MPDFKLELLPSPGTHELHYRGDTLYFTLTVTPPIPGALAFLHTNIGCAEIRRRELFRYTEDRVPIASQDWHDVPMIETEPGVFRLRMALNQIGHFEASACLIPEAGADPVWADGGQICINVEPASYCSANSIYCAFVRQFGPNKTNAKREVAAPVETATALLDEDLYTVIPPSGTFRSLIKELDFIIDHLQCRILHLLPVNPVPTTYARMGRFGSPYAALDFTAIDPAYAEFDRKATPLDQFIELVDAVHLRGAKIFIDLAINHTGWAAKIHETHPEWLVREADGAIHSPGAWGVVWGDLTELDYKKKSLWLQMAEVFLTWCARGVDGFRCDAGYMIPFDAWQYIIARVRHSYPETIFLLEGLGGDPAITLKLLNNANMNWAYSELFQNYSREAIEGYLNYSMNVSGADGLMVNYAETHDNARLAATSVTWAKMRTGLSALTSVNGAFGFTNGVEWFAKEKVDVHLDCALNWGAEENQVDYIRRLNTILIRHPAFHPGAAFRFVDSGTRDAVLLFRTDSHNKHPLLVCVNINCEHPTVVSWKVGDVPFIVGVDGEVHLTDLISGKRMVLLRVDGHRIAHTLQPGEVVCFAPDSDMVDDEANAPMNRILRQRLRAQILDILCWRNGSNVLAESVDMVDLVKKLYEDPHAFLKSLYDQSELPKIVHFAWPRDQTREVMLPPNHLLVVTADTPFSAALIDHHKTVNRQRSSVRSESGIHFVVFIPLVVPESHEQISLRIFTTEDGRSKRKECPLLLLAQNVETCKLEFCNDDLRRAERNVLLTNGKGAMIRPAVEWGVLADRYNALLAANFSTDYPEDRHIMFRRLRIKVQHHARTEEIRIDVTRHFRVNQRFEPVWEFFVPVGKGEHIALAATLSAVQGKNAVRIALRRKATDTPKDASESPLGDAKIRVLLCPDLEDRNFHNETKAYAGPERLWSQALKVSEDRATMLFAPSQDRFLRLCSDRARFNVNPMWFYNVYQPKETARGLEAHTDVWSPGFFEVYLRPDEEVVIRADVFRSQAEVDAQTPDFSMPPVDPVIAEIAREHHGPRERFENVLRAAMTRFVVDRDAWKTVIAGYPWFLDWGRDTMICARGLISAGFTKEVRAIILQFAKFMESGTMPNIIHGTEVGNRDTSDATLWLYVVLADYLKYTGDNAVLQEVLHNDLTLQEILVDTALQLRKGTPNGIVVDAESNLVFSPSHFTWMDTNYPAGTPRQGYPIEIQSLWYAAQTTLFDITNDETWFTAAAKTRASVLEYFTLPNGALSDCLNAEPGTPAAKAVRTDHLRPNQLFAVTLGVVTDPMTCRAIIRNTSYLLIPGAIRTLGAGSVEVPIPVSWHGSLLNDPANPYWGRYEGDEDTRRKPAYHNGTAWTWPFPSFAEALVMTYRENALTTAKSILSTIRIPMDVGCVGQLPEILDGDYPHLPRGCDAQAWGATEAYRVWKLLQEMS